MANSKIVFKYDNEVKVLDNIRDVDNLSTLRMNYNSIIYCRGGRILVEIGGNNQINVKPGQLFLIPRGKLVQPMMVSTDVEASALLFSDRALKSILGNQINIWNKAMYMKEIYVLESANWLEAFGEYTRCIFQRDPMPILYDEITSSFLRMLMLLLCEELMKHEDMMHSDDISTMHDKEIFNQFLQLLANQKQKRQRVSFYANQLNITSKYLSTVCKRVSGKSPIRWIIESVMQDGYSLLTETDLSVKEISNILGFPNSSFFGQYFREQAGITPIEYRLEHKKMI